jgi:TonB family protein
MAFRALLFSKGPETNTSLSSACKEAGIRVDVCADIFSAIEKGTKQTFSCVLCDWSDQPEAGFLLKRSRESAQNAGIVAIALVDNEPTSAEVRDNRLDFLVFKPVVVPEACEVLLKAKEKMQAVAAEAMTEAIAAEESAGTTGTGPESDNRSSAHSEDSASDLAFDGEPVASSSSSFEFPFRQVMAALLLAAAAFCLWRAHDTIRYLAHTPENRMQIVRDSVASLFYINSSGTVPLDAAGSDAQQDAYFSRSVPVAAGPSGKIAVVSSEAQLSDSHVDVPKAYDFPLPTPVYEPPAPPPVHVERAAIPDSLRSSAPITPPVVVTTTPAQMMPVSAPLLAPVPQQFAEPVSVPEEAQRALLIHRVDPTYPPEAAPQKLHGPVVLQATIGRDGSVQDLKILRGSFILCKAAIAAVKQWRFQPYTLNGRAAQTQTTITVNFNFPPG